jgi:hypothetical protein
VNVIEYECECDEFNSNDNANERNSIKEEMNSSEKKNHHFNKKQHNNTPQQQQ